MQGIAKRLLIWVTGIILVTALFFLPIWLWQARAINNANLRTIAVSSFMVAYALTLCLFTYYVTGHQENDADKEKDEKVN